MKIKVNYYTSFYSKILKRHKTDFDFYVQVSRSLIFPKKNIDNINLRDLLDLNAGDILGNFFETKEEYLAYLDEIKEDEVFKDVLNFLELKEIIEQTEKDLADITIEDLQKENKKEYDSLMEQGIIDSEGNLCFNVFLLCYEDLNSVYTKKDEEKTEGLVKAGQKKICHRTYISEYLNKNYGYSFKEYEAM